jgi:hypothetical protein
MIGMARTEARCNWSGHIDKVLSMFPKFCCPAGAPFSERSLGKSLCYYSFQSSRAATILYHRKRIAEAMWGRLATCGRLAIGLQRPVRNLPGRWLWVCGLPPCGADCQNRPAGSAYSAEESRVLLTACRFAGRFFPAESARTQSYRRIDPRSPPRRQITGHRSHARKHDWHGEKRQWIGRGHSEK